MSVLEIIIIVVAEVTLLVGAGFFFAWLIVKWIERP